MKIFPKQIFDYISSIELCLVQASVNNDHDLVKLIHDQLIIDLKNSHSLRVNKYLIEPLMIFFFSETSVADLGGGVVRWVRSLPF
jgi:hypothetical protein